MFSRVQRRYRRVESEESARGGGWSLFSWLTGEGNGRKRKVTRRAVRTRCEVVTVNGFQRLGVEASELSEEGLFLETDHVPALGERVIVTLRIPNSRLWIDAEGEVVRIARGQRTTTPIPESPPVPQPPRGKRADPRDQAPISESSPVPQPPRGKRADPRGLGIRFTRLDMFSKIMLRESLRGLPPPIPKRRLRVDYATLVHQIWTHP